MSTQHIPAALAPTLDLSACDTFERRHIGISQEAEAAMLQSLGVDSLDALCAQTVPEDIAFKRPLALAGLPAPQGEAATLERLRQMAAHNTVLRSFIGMGYTPCVTPPVIARNIFENPGWYTQYTPYQAEIAQGRLEALLNFQTMVSDLTGLGFANASLLDEATAAAEAMAMCRALAPTKTAFFASERCHPQTLAVLKTRADSLGLTLMVGDVSQAHLHAQALFGVLVQYPDTFGRIDDYEALCQQMHAQGAYVVCACDLLSLTLLRPPGEFGADIAVGSAQRFGVPMGFGGPHAAFLATHPTYKRQMPGRVIGVSRDARGKPALRMALQTREQHIRREKATSNICTAQALLAIMASMYGVYHGPDGLRDIAHRVQRMTTRLGSCLEAMGYSVLHKAVFDTLLVALPHADAQALHTRGHAQNFNLRPIDAQKVCITLDEACTNEDLQRLVEVFAAHLQAAVPAPADRAADPLWALPERLVRQSSYLTHPVFNSYHTEHEMLRYIHRLEGRDLSLAHAMIPLGSCTMKLNATSEMLPVSWPAFAQMHPFAPPAQTQGYTRLFDDLRAWLGEITGFAGVSLQPNAGAQGEYAGLMVIRAYHRARGQTERNVCLIPVSAHGTNPASAALAGMRVVVVACDAAGNVDVADLAHKAQAHAADLAALMVTYPSTHGVFEGSIGQMCQIVHAHGGQVYLDGANMNAQVGLCRPGDFGADVCHLNLHKTFCIPHGGGGPGMGPIGVAAHLTPFLPQHALGHDATAQTMGPVSAAPWGSASILPISWMYIAMMGPGGLRRATQVAILNANYMAERLKDAYTVLYRGAQGRVGHEFILDLRPFKAMAGIEAEDVAKRLMDYGFHAPTMSFPVAGTLMIEPTESESRRELDRLCDALIAIRAEIKAIADGQMDTQDNPLKNAPHTADMVSSDTWTHPYARTLGAYPAPWLLEHKFWPSVGRIDNAFGDRNLVCTCPPLSAYES